MTTTYYVPGSEEKDPAKVIMSLQQAHSKTATNTTDIATNTANIATNTANIATNTANIATNTGNIATNTSNIATQTAALAALTGSKITASLGADVALNNTANYFDGPSIAQGSTGTWRVSGAVTVQDTAGAANIDAKLWDGTTVIASSRGTISAANFFVSIALSGDIASPAGNLRISVKDNASTSGKIIFNATGNSKDSTITADRVA